MRTTRHVFCCPFDVIGGERGRGRGDLAVSPGKEKKEGDRKRDREKKEGERKRKEREKIRSPFLSPFLRSLPLEELNLHLFPRPTHPLSESFQSCFLPYKLLVEGGGEGGRLAVLKYCACVFPWKE